MGKNNYDFICQIQNYQKKQSIKHSHQQLYTAGTVHFQNDISVSSLAASTPCRNVSAHPLIFYSAADSLLFTSFL